MCRQRRSPQRPRRCCGATAPTSPFTTRTARRDSARTREFVVGKVAGRGIHCSPDEVLITSGSGQGLDLVNRVLLERGDTVILEEFTYGGALTKLQRLGVTVVGAPLDDDGLRIDALAQILDDLKRKGTVPKYIYTIPTVQNPTGSILPLDRRHALLGLARSTACRSSRTSATPIWCGATVRRRRSIRWTRAR